MDGVITDGGGVRGKGAVYESIGEGNAWWAWASKSLHTYHEKPSENGTVQQKYSTQKARSRSQPRRKFDRGSISIACFFFFLFFLVLCGITVARHLREQIPNHGHLGAGFRPAVNQLAARSF